MNVKGSRPSMGPTQSRLQSVLGSSGRMWSWPTVNLKLRLNTRNSSPTLTYFSWHSAQLSRGTTLFWRSTLQYTKFVHLHLLLLLLLLLYPLIQLCISLYFLVHIIFIRAVSSKLVWRYISRLIFLWCGVRNSVKTWDVLLKFVVFFLRPFSKTTVATQLSCRFFLARRLQFLSDPNHWCSAI